MKQRSGQPKQSQEPDETLFKLLSDCARNGLAPEPSKFMTRSGFPLLPTKPEASPVTTQHVADLLDALDREEIA